jgi:hypothetical protein
MVFNGGIILLKRGDGILQGPKFSTFYTPSRASSMLGGSSVEPIYILLSFGGDRCCFAKAVTYTATLPHSGSKL